MQRTHQFRLPIFAGRVIFIACSDLTKARNGYASTFGPYDACACEALVSCDNKGKFALFFQGHNVSHEYIAHEVLHLTHRIMEYNNHELTPNGHEPHACLCGFLTDALYRKLKQWKVAIK